MCFFGSNNNCCNGGWNYGEEDKKCNYTPCKSNCQWGCKDDCEKKYKDNCEKKYVITISEYKEKREKPSCCCNCCCNCNY